MFEASYVMTDAQLVNGCRDGNANAQRELFERFAQKMMGVCVRYTDSTEEAEDMLQDGFIKVFAKLDSFRGEGSLEGWLRRIMVNTALENFRRLKEQKQNTEGGVEDLQISNFDNPEDKLGEKDLLNMIKSMPQGYRIIFNLYAIEGYTHKEIGEQLGLSEGTSKSQYARARVYLQKVLLTEKV